MASFRYPPRRAKYPSNSLEVLRFLNVTGVCRPCPWQVGVHLPVPIGVPDFLFVRVVEDPNQSLTTLWPVDFLHGGHLVKVIGNPKVIFLQSSLSHFLHWQRSLQFRTQWHLIRQFPTGKKHVSGGTVVGLSNKKTYWGGKVTVPQV